MGDYGHKHSRYCRKKIARPRQQMLVSGLRTQPNGMPSSKTAQTFDVFIYLIRHQSENLSDVVVAEFFLGPYWENKVFPAVAQDGFIGISTSAYGTFLCICRVTFIDGSHIYLTVTLISRCSEQVAREPNLEVSFRRLLPACG